MKEKYSKEGMIEGRREKEKKKRNKERKKKEKEGKKKEKKKWNKESHKTELLHCQEIPDTLSYKEQNATFLSS